jgi:hypothetical protein
LFHLSYGSFVFSILFPSNGIPRLFLLVAAVILLRFLRQSCHLAHSSFAVLMSVLVYPKFRLFARYRKPFQRFIGHPGLSFLDSFP